MKKGLSTNFYIALILFIALIFTMIVFSTIKLTGDVINGQPISNTTKCNDSDSGIYYDKAGNVTYKNLLGLIVTKKDSCKNNTLTEYYCAPQSSRKIINTSKVDCKDVFKDGLCEKGACIDRYTCLSDSDNTLANPIASYYIKGSILFANNTRLTDFCYTTSTNPTPNLLFEYGCNKTRIYFQIYKCENGCLSGKCRNA